MPVARVSPLHLVPYAETPFVVLRQVLGDVLVVLWCVFWWREADDVREQVLRLQGAGRQAEDAGTGISERLRSAGDAIDGVPFAGRPLASPLRSAADASDGLADAGRSAQSAVATTATVLHAVMVLVLVVAVALWWLRRRSGWVRTAATARRLRASTTGLQVLGVRGAAHLPLAALATAVQGSRAEATGGTVDSELLADLGVLELRRLGLRGGSSARPERTRAGAPQP